MIYKVPLVLTPQPEGGFTVTSPLLPELLTEGNTIEEAMENVHDALQATIEIYHDLGRQLPKNVQISDVTSPVWLV
jgi:antitoxin HicB